MILVVGATSHPGQALVPMLLEKGYPVRAMTRVPLKAQWMQELGAEVIQGDLRQPETIWKACQGVKRVVCSVCAPLNQGDNNIHTVDDWGIRLLVYEAMAAGVQHFVLVSACGVCADYPVDFGRAKYHSEEFLKESGLSYTILRATAFMEVWGAMIGDPVIAGKRVMIFGDGKNPVNFISAVDVAKYIVIALEDPRLWDQVVDIGGPENLTLDEVADLYERLTGHNARRQHLPSGMIKMMSRVLWPFKEGPARLMALAYLMTTTDQRLDMQALLQRYPVNLKSMEEAAREKIVSCKTSDNEEDSKAPLPTDFIPVHH